MIQWMVTGLIYKMTDDPNDLDPNWLLASHQLLMKKLFDDLLSPTFYNHHHLHRHPTHIQRVDWSSFDTQDHHHRHHPSGHEKNFNKKGDSWVNIIIMVIKKREVVTKTYLKGTEESSRHKCINRFVNNWLNCSTWLHMTTIICIPG